MGKPSQVILLLEDDHQKMLLYRYLKRCGLSRAIRVSPHVPGRGSAEQRVRTQFAAEVRAYRGRQAKAETSLIVVIDADENTVQERLNQLDQALEDAGQEGIAIEEERVARLIPKRNIETWILCLTGTNVDEQTDYKGSNADWNRLMPGGAEELYQWTRPNAEPPIRCIESLRTGVTELKRLAL